MTSVAAESIRHAVIPADVELARGLFLEYAARLEIDLCFQGFESELATLPGAYAPPRGRLLLAGVAGDAFGCGALRPLPVSSGSGRATASDSTATDVGEVKRLYVRTSHRGGGWGRRLAEAVIAEARAIGYSTLKLDTLDFMTEARALYATLGFRECAPYYENPTPGVVYMALDL